MAQKTTVDLDIEFAHIYKNENFSIEHQRAIEVLKETLQRKDIEKSNTIYGVMIDDYNFEEEILDEHEFIHLLKIQKVAPKYVVKEAEIVSLHSGLQNAFIKKRNREEYEKYYAKHAKFPCSYLVACWYLFRLGYIEGSRELRKSYPYRAVRMITILPERFRDVEDKALQIIGQTHYAEALQKIEHVFFD